MFRSKRITGKWRSYTHAMPPPPHIPLLSPSSRLSSIPPPTRPFRYKVSFTAIGTMMYCSLYAADEDAVAYGSPLISVEYDVTDDDYVTSSGAPSFMARGEEMGYVAKFSFEDLD